jgi:uncharacterized protein HemX
VQPQPARRAPKKRRGLRAFLAIVALVAVVAIGLAIYESTSSGQQKMVKINQQIRGDVNDTIDSIKQLIQDNTR